MRDWLQWSDAQHKFLNEQNLRDFYSWITPGSDGTAKITSPTLDIRKLRTIVGKPQALEALRQPETSLQEANQLATNQPTTNRAAAALEQAALSTVRALDDLPRTALRALTDEQLEVLRQLAAKITETIDDYERLKVRRV